MKKPHFLIFSATVFFCASCASYKKNIMFRVEDPAALTQLKNDAEADFIISPNDVLQLEVYTNDGEKLVDPVFNAATEDPVSNEQPGPKEYAIDLNGVAKLPLVGEMKLEGLTLRQAEEMLAKAYAKFYKQPFIILNFASKRAFVLGAPGGQVIPLTYPNMKLTEVLALAEGIGSEASSGNIRVLRGKQVFLVDFSTIEGYINDDLIIQPGDIIYVEPVRRPFSEGLRDYGPLLSMITSIGTLIVVILQLNNP